jgi:hypothetical protein
MIGSPFSFLVKEGARVIKHAFQHPQMKWHRIERMVDWLAGLL